MFSAGFGSITGFGFCVFSILISSLIWPRVSVARAPSVHIKFQVHFCAFVALTAERKFRFRSAFYLLFLSVSPTFMPTDKILSATFEFKMSFCLFVSDFDSFYFSSDYRCPLTLYFIHG